MKIFEEYTELYTKQTFDDWTSTLNDNIYTFNEKDLDILRKVADTYGYKMIMDDLHAIWDDDHNTFVLRDNNDMFFIPLYKSTVMLDGEEFQIPSKNYTISNFSVLFFKEEKYITKSIWINKINDDGYFFVDVGIEARQQNAGLTRERVVSFNCDYIDGLKKILDDETWI